MSTFLWMFYIVRDTVVGNGLDVTSTGPRDGMCFVRSSHRVKS